MSLKPEDWLQTFTLQFEVLGLLLLVILPSLIMGIHIPRTSTLVSSNVSHHASNPGAVTFPCSSLYTLTHSLKLEKLKKVVKKRLKRKLLVPTASLKQTLEYLSSVLHVMSTAPKTYILRPPPCKLFACYIS